MSKGGDIAATSIGMAGSIFAAAASANAIPVAGQFVSAGLAIAGMFIKIFAGRKKKKDAEKKRKQEAADQKLVNSMGEKGQDSANSGTVGGAGAQGQQPISATARAAAPVTSSFQTWGGGNAPSVQPTQQVLNNQLGMK